MAFRLAGGDEIELVQLIEVSADNVETALSRAHLHKESGKLQKAVSRLGADVVPLFGLFPETRKRVVEGLRA